MEFFSHSQKARKMARLHLRTFLRKAYLRLFSAQRFFQLFTPFSHQPRTQRDKFRIYLSHQAEVHLFCKRAILQT